LQLNEENLTDAASNLIGSLLTSFANLPLENALEKDVFNSFYQLF